MSHVYTDTIIQRDHYINDKGNRYQDNISTDPGTTSLMYQTVNTG
jgi:hypothetical protein